MHQIKCLFLAAQLIEHSGTFNCNTPKQGHLFIEARNLFLCGNYTLLNKQTGRTHNSMYPVSGNLFIQ